MPIAHTVHENVKICHYEKEGLLKGTFLLGENDQSERSCPNRKSFSSWPNQSLFSDSSFWKLIQRELELLWKKIVFFFGGGRCKWTFSVSSKTRIWCAYALWWSKQSNCQESQWNHLVMHEPWMLLLWQWGGENFTTNVTLTFFASEYLFVFSYSYLEHNTSPCYLNFT